MRKALYFVVIGALIAVQSWAVFGSTKDERHAVSVCQYV